MDPFILIDGSSYLFRAYHAMPALTNSRNEPTGAIYGVVNMLRKLMAAESTPHIVVVFDPKGDNFRHELYPAYKANRGETPEDLIPQFKPLFTVIKAMGLPLIIVDNVEADDVIGTLAVQASAQGHPVIISTSDKDMAQLVNDQVSLHNTMTDKRLDQQGVFEKFNVRPDQIIDYLTLMGDTVDNIPGVSKVGPKTAAKWLGQYNDLDTIITHANEISGKVGENFRAALPDLPLSKQLVTIKLNVDMPYTLDDLKRKEPDEALLQEWFSRLEFKAWLNDLKPKPKQTAHYDIIFEQTQFENWLTLLEQADVFSFDLETTGLDYMSADIVGLSFAICPFQAAYVPLAHDYMGAPQQLDRSTILEQLKPLLESREHLKLGQNLKYDQSILARYDIELNGIAYDTMLESYVQNSTANRHDMDTLALKYLSRSTIHFEDIAGKGAKQLRFNEIPIEEAGPYAAEDADVTLQLHQTLWPTIADDDKLFHVFCDIEMPLLPILSKMERHGVLLDSALLEKQSHQIAKQLSSLEEQAHQLADKSFNLNSPKQLREILFVDLGLPILKKTPSCDPSTAEAVLEELALDYPLPQIILSYRSLAKLKSTYTDRLPEQVHPNSKRVHTSYHQAVTSTGRLSSSDPNLQNIPIRTEQGRKIRQAFIAPTGSQLLALDYSQIELRIMAHLSNDTGLLTAFRQNKDIHRATAAEVFCCDNETAVSDDQRRRAKAINFGLIYGMSAFGLAKQLGVDRHEAQSYIDLYFSRYPGVKAYMDDTRELARAQGYVETLYGRRLYLPEINANNFMRRQAAERAAINAPMQGTAADLIKRAMIRIDNWLIKQKLPAYLIMQVHDELVFEIDNSLVDNLPQTLADLMCSDHCLSVPLIVSIGLGQNWDDAH